MTCLSGELPDRQYNLEYKEFEKEYRIHFRMNVSAIEPEFKGNAAELARLKTCIDSLMRINPEYISKIRIRATASPDGSYRFNQALAQKRALNLKDYLLRLAPPNNDIKIEITSLPEDWDTMGKIVENDPYFPDREKLLGLIYDDSIPLDQKEKTLRQMRNAFRAIIDHHAYLMRTSTAIITISIPVIDIPQLDAIKDSLAIPESGLAYHPKNIEPERTKVPQTLFAPKTNLLVPGLNVGIDVPIGNHFSVGLNYWYPWWLHKKNMYCGEMLGLFADVKYWFGDRIGDYGWTSGSKLKGHAVGIYGGAGYYDYQKKKSGYQGEYIDVGVDYTYSLPVGKKKQFRIEFNIGLGWIYTQARHYTPTEDYEILIKDPGIKHEKFNFFGPTRAGVSFVWPIVVNKNVKKQK